MTLHPWILFGAVLIAGCGSRATDPNSSATGSWVGYVENYSFESNSDRVAVELQVADGKVFGSVTLGDGSPPVVDPDVGFPRPFDSRYIQEGFAFSMVSGGATPPRIKFTIRISDQWQAWCEAQMPIADEKNPEKYRCLPNWGGGGDGQGCFLRDPNTDQKQAVDCAKLEMCKLGRVCRCEASGCTAEPGQEFAFDVRHEGDRLIGTLRTAPASVFNVFLDRE